MQQYGGLPSFLFEETMGSRPRNSGGLAPAARSSFHKQSGEASFGNGKSSGSSPPPFCFPQKDWALGMRVDGEETCSTPSRPPPRPPRGKRPGGCPVLEDPSVHGCTTFNLEGMSPPHSLFPQLQRKEWRRVLPTLSVSLVFPSPFREKSAILHTCVRFRTLNLQLLPNAFARGIYEAIDDVQQSSMERILIFGNFWKLT